MQVIVNNTHKVFPFTNNRFVPTWAKSILYSSLKIKNVNLVLRHLNSSFEQ